MSHLFKIISLFHNNKLKEDIRDFNTQYDCKYFLKSRVGCSSFRFIKLGHASRRINDSEFEDSPFGD